MLARLILLTACLMAYSPTLRAGQIIFDCDVVFEVTGRATHHVIVVDTEHGIVRYDDMTTGNGVKTPDAANLEEWVQIDGGLAAWRHGATVTPMAAFYEQVRAEATDRHFHHHEHCERPDRPRLVPGLALTS